MTIAKRTPIFQCLLLAGVISLTACGGSGGGGKKQPPIDTTPNAITLAASNNVEPSTVVTSAPVTVTGINTAAPVSIVGGEYSISGGAFTANPGSITNGQTLTVRITAPDKTNTPKEAVVTVGGVSAKFTVTTVADVTPDAFTFAPKSDAQLNAEYTSDAITVSGIDIAVPVSIAGGLYSINGGGFTSAAGTVSAGQTITVKTTAAAKTETAQNAVLTIGGVSGTFTVTTIQDSFAPVAEFKFPTPYTMSEAMSVKVRGTATDDNAITNVKVVVRSYKLEAPTVTLSTTEINATPKAEANGIKDFSSWTVDVPLTALAENEIKVVATDVRNNSIAVDTANKVVIRQANVSNAFPDEMNPFSFIFQGLALDPARDRVLIVQNGNVYAIDSKTGQRTKLIETPSTLSGIAVDASQNRLYAIRDASIVEYQLDDLAVGPITYQTDLVENIRAIEIDVNSRTIFGVEKLYRRSGARIIRFSLDSKNFSLLGSNDVEPQLVSSEGITLDTGNNQLFITTGGQNSDSNQLGVVSVNVETGDRQILTNNSVGQGEKFRGLLPSGIESGVFHVEFGEGEMFLVENPNRLFRVNLNTGDRLMVSDISYKNPPAGYDAYVEYGAMQYEKESQNLFLIETLRSAVFVVDSETNERVILSKSKNNF